METIDTELTAQQAIAKVVNGEHLSRAEARSVMGQIMDGAATAVQIGSLATALRMKGETLDEITGFAETMRSHSRHVLTEQRQLLDTCGTGGTGIHKFNISTASAIIAAAASVRVAKHGNRAMSGKAGSADVLEALGVNITITSEQAAACLEQVGICFMFAQLYHPSLKHAAVPRREIGVRTVFNMLGPLSNPAGADSQMLGLYDRSKTELIANVLKELQVKRAMVVASHDGLDEISISGPTQISELSQDSIRTFDLHPDELGLQTFPLSSIIGGDTQTNAEIIRSVFSGAQGAYRNIVLANAGACIYVAGRCKTMQEGVKLAANMIDTGLASKKLQQLIDYTGALSHDT